MRLLTETWLVRRAPVVVALGLVLATLAFGVSLTLDRAQAVTPGAQLEHTAPSVVTTTGASILGIATQAVGTHQGECFPWVRRVVEAATGRTIGFHYRQGYFDAGATEVSLAEAAPGDVIQIIDDNDSGPDADHPGMHTSIVLENNGGGIFRVVDSNEGFDGMVGIRNGYNPMAVAGRYPNVNVHVYRFSSSAPGAPAPSATATPSTQAVLFSPAPGGASGGVTTSPQQALPTATVRADGDCLRMRTSAGVAATVMTCIPDGATVNVLPGTQQADGMQWQAVSYGGSSGWVAAQYLSSATAPSPTPVASSTPRPAASTPTPAPTAAGSVPAASVVGQVPVNGGLALVVYNGGTVSSLVQTVSVRGCNLVSIWTNRAGGGLVGMIPGAPPVVNREWTTEYPDGTLGAQTPLIVVCRGESTGTAANTPTSPQPGTVVERGEGPPGPAGNE